jgi:hypothetical protein
MLIRGIRMRKIWALVFVQRAERQRGQDRSARARVRAAQAAPHVEHRAGDAAEGFQLHKLRLRLMDIPRDANGFGDAVEAGIAAVESSRNVARRERFRRIALSAGVLQCRAEVNG